MRSKKTTIAPFEVTKFLASAGIATRVATYKRAEAIFSQGDEADSVMYIQDGVVKLTVLSKTGKEAVVAILAAGDFFGEGCLAGQTIRMGSATSIPATTVLVIGRQHMVRMLHTQPALSDRFLSHVLARNIRIEQDLVDQLFNSSEKRLARALMLMARYGKAEKTHHVIPKLSQDVLAEMVGTTRSRVNFFMNKFRKLGFIEYNGGLKINSSLLSVVLHE
jgi:CRP/FNR family cyclic AMP-dependent transcriptional regulator